MAESCRQPKLQTMTEGLCTATIVTPVGVFPVV
jgi:hypothetical protein